MKKQKKIENILDETKESLIHFKDAAKILNMPYTTLYTKIRKKHIMIDVIRKLNKNYIRKDDLEKIKISLSRGWNSTENIPSGENIRITLAECANLLGVSYQLLKLWRHEKKFDVPCQKINGKLRMKYIDVMQFVEEKTRFENNFWFLDR